jgi:hypothetical protein
MRTYSPPPQRLRRLTLVGSILLLVMVAAVVLLLVDFRLKRLAAEHRLILGGNAPTGLPQLDGQIDPQEWAYHYRDGKIRMDLYWKIIGDTIYMALQSPAHGWVAISLAPSGPQMLGGDVIIGYMKDGQVYVSDDYADTLTSHRPDIELGGSNDILAAGGSESEQGTIIELERKLSTLDRYDRPIVPTDMPVQLAYSNGKDFSSYHDQNRDSVLINFFTGKVTEAGGP